MGTVATRRPPTVVLRAFQRAEDGQHASPGRQWQVVDSAPSGRAATVAAMAQEAFMSGKWTVLIDNRRQTDRQTDNGP